MKKSEITKLIEAMNNATSLNEIEITWSGDKFVIESNDRTALTLVYLFITQCTLHSVISWEKDEHTYKNYLKGWII